MNYGLIKTSWGVFGFVHDNGRLLATYLPGPAPKIIAAIRRAFPDAVEGKSDLPEFRRDVTDYYAGRMPRFNVKLDLSKTPPFRRRVLEALRRVPFGQTVSYTDLARAVGSPRASRAVGGAMANNPLPLVIPCHRVLRADQSIGGFSSMGGPKDKLRMLELEGAA